MNESNSNPTSFSLLWPLFIGLLSLVYLGIEFGFNSLIIDTVAGIPSVEDTERLELVGRTVSGIGFTLIAWGVIAKRSQRSASTKWFWMAIALIICFPCMFFGQKALIDYVVNQSTGDQRLLSRYMSLLKTGLADGVIEIDGLPLESSQKQTPEDKTFLALVGGLIYFNPTFLDTVENNQDKIVDQVIRRLTMSSLDVHYHDYLNVRRSVSNYWGLYKEGSSSYYSIISAKDVKAQDAWVEINNKVLASWKSFDEGRAKWQTRWGKEGDNFYPQATKMFEQWSRCSNRKSCNDRAEHKYRKEMIRIFARDDLPFQHWCVNGYLGLFLYPKDSYKIKGRQCPTKQDVFRDRFIEASTRIFYQKTGLPFDTTEAQFIANDKIRRDVTAALIKEGIHLPENWKLTDQRTFILAVKEKIVRDANQEFMEAIGEVIHNSDSIRPGMDYTEFVNHVAIQGKVQSRMGDAYVKGMRFNWSKDSFLSNVLNPMIERQVQREIDNLKKGANAYENNQPLEQIGKQSMRSILVPPIAIAFSIFFGLWNLLNLISSIFLLTKSGNAAPLIRASITASIFLCIFFTPFVLTNNYSSNKVVGYFVDESQKANPLLGHAFDWMIRIQPVVYPLGRTVREVWHSFTP